MSKYTMYSKKENTLYIKSTVILPNCAGMPLAERRKANRAAFDMTYEQRLEAFCPEPIRKEIQAEIDRHPGCVISEYCDI